MTIQEKQGLMSRFGLSEQEAEVQAKANLEARRQTWLKEVIDPLSAKHGITRIQMISVLFCDNSEPLTTDKAYWAEGNEFAGATMKEVGVTPYHPIGAKRSSRGDVERFVSHDRQLELIDLAERGSPAAAIRLAIREAVEAALVTGVPAAPASESPHHPAMT